MHVCGLNYTRENKQPVKTMHLAGVFNENQE